MGGRDVEAELVHQPREPRRLSLGKVEHQPRKRGGVDDRMLERTLQAPAHQPGVKGVVAVLDQHRTLREP
ncbi:MAG TPA: hypothetical protein VEN12_08005 [Verrucomicrobiae bacterium]|nr:hypothetical protein [Verrucomicrobiae bacterium]